MKLLKNSTAIKAWLALMLFCVASLSWAAQVAGTIVQLSGPLMARKADGGVKVLSMKSEVESGDTLVTEKNTYAMIKFIDNSEITLKPSTTFKVENFAYDAGNPGADNASFNLVKGGLRSVTGLLGKRNKEKFAMKTPSATIGIRGTTFIAEIVEPTAQALAAREAYLLASTAALDPLAAPVQPLMLAQGPAPITPTGMAPGLYVQVLDGMIALSNQGGVTQFSVGQFGFTPNFQVPPVILPQNPGLKFSPPPVFSSTTGAQNTAGTPAKSNSVDCEVR